MIYFLTAVWCYVLTRRAPRAFWWAIIGILALFGLSTLTNFPQHMTIVGRQFALEYGWYRTRRPVQAYGSIAILLASIALVVGLRTQFRSLRAPEWLTLLAIGSLLNLTIIRAISFHDVDNLLSTRLFGLRFGVIAELLLLLCIVVASAWAGWRSRTEYSGVRSQNTEPRTKN